MVVFLWEVAERFYKTRRFRGRPRLQQQEVLSLFKTAALPDRDVLQVLRYVSRASSIPLGLLRSQDRFAIELAPVRGLSFDDGILLLGDALAAEFDARQGEIDPFTAKDLRGLLQQIAVVRDRQHAVGNNGKGNQGKEHASQA